MATKRAGLTQKGEGTDLSAWFTQGCVTPPNFKVNQSARVMCLK